VPNEEEDDFRSYRKLIIRQLEMQDEALAQFRKECEGIKIQLAVLNTKAALYSGVIAFVTSAGVALALKFVAK
jgi:hypothetical protein